MADIDKERLSQLKMFCRASYAASSFLEALSHLEEMLKYNRKEDGQVWQAFWIAAVVSYCRPFTRNDGLGKESTNLIPERFKGLHERIYEEHRNDTLAHTDPNKKEMNSLVFTVTKTPNHTDIWHDPTRYHPKTAEVEEFLEMVREIYRSSGELVKERMLHLPETAL